MECDRHETRDFWVGDRHETRDFWVSDRHETRDFWVSYRHETRDFWVGDRHLHRGDYGPARATIRWLNGHSSNYDLAALCVQK